MIEFEQAEPDVLVAEAEGIIIDGLGLDFEAGGMLSVGVSHCAGFEIAFRTVTRAEIERQTRNPRVVEAALAKARPRLVRDPDEQRFLLLDLRLESDGRTARRVLDRPTSELVRKAEAFFADKPATQRIDGRELVSAVLRNMGRLHVFGELDRETFERLELVVATDDAGLLGGEASLALEWPAR